MKLGKVSGAFAVMALATVAAATACTSATDDGESGRVSSPAKKNPPGNNGTVKIQEETATDEIPDNDPHVGCNFKIEFRGFDLGADLMATWELDAQPPSGNGDLVAKGELNIGEDAAGGANDLDGVVHIKIADYDLSGLTRQDQQGYHLKLTVHADGSIGADTKHKVFWVDGCTPEAPDAGTTSSTSSSSGGSSTSSSGGHAW